jgi:hypothetical protein
MADLDADKQMQYQEGVEISIPMGASKEIFAGSMVCLDGSTRYAEHASDGSGKVFVGIAREYKKDIAAAAGAQNILTRQRGRWLLDYYEGDATQADVGKPVFVKTDQAVALAAHVSYLIYAGIIMAIESVSKVWVDIYPALLQTDVATHLADTSSAHAATAIEAAAGGLDIPANVQLALAELYQNALTIQGTIPIPLGAITQEDGTVLAKLNSTASGYEQLSNKEQVITIPVNATIEALGFSVPVPQDLDDAKDIEVHVLAGKGGALDTLTLDCEIFPSAAGDVGNADIQDTAAITITQAISELIFTGLAAGVLAAPGTLTGILTLGGTNDGDIVYIYGVWIEYAKKLLTS